MPVSVKISIVVGGELPVRMVFQGRLNCYSYHTPFVRTSDILVRLLKKIRALLEVIFVVVGSCHDLVHHWNRFVPGTKCPPWDWRISTFSPFSSSVGMDGGLLKAVIQGLRIGSIIFAQKFIRNSKARVHAACIRSYSNSTKETTYRSIDLYVRTKLARRENTHIS